MNKLRGMTVYLCGAMDLSADSGIGWREKVTPKLKEFGLRVRNPCKKPKSSIALEDTETRKIRREHKLSGDYEYVAQEMRGVRHIDLHMVDTSNFLIVYINLDEYAVGTTEEYTWANRCKKPVLIVVKQGKNHCPDWIFGMINHNHIFSTFDEVFEYLRGVDDGSDTNTYKRWVFFEDLCDE